MDNKKIAFIHIPKTAGTYINYVLNKENIKFYWNINHNGGTHYEISDINLKFLDNTSFYIFTVIRCPIKRFLSAYFYSKQNLNKKYFEQVKIFFIKNKINNFNDLINLLKKNPKIVFSLSGSFAPQYKWIYKNNKLFVKNIFVLENDNFYKTFNINKLKYNIKKNTSKYDENITLTDDIKNIIINSYKIDYELYIKHK
jgi:hypothetical protein